MSIGIAAAVPDAIVLTADSATTGADGQIRRGTVKVFPVQWAGGTGAAITSGIASFDGREARAAVQGAFKELGDVPLADIPGHVTEHLLSDGMDAGRQVNLVFATYDDAGPVLLVRRTDAGTGKILSEGGNLSGPRMRTFWTGNVEMMRHLLRPPKALPSLVGRNAAMGLVDAVEYSQWACQTICDWQRFAGVAQTCQPPLVTGILKPSGFAYWEGSEWAL